MNICEIKIAKSVIGSDLTRKLDAQDAEYYSAVLYEENFYYYSILVSCVPDFEKLFGAFHVSGDLNDLARLIKAVNDYFLDDLDEKREMLISEQEDDGLPPVMPSSFFEFG